MEVQAHRKTSFDEMTEPGDYVFTARQGVEGHAGLLFVCPCGCGEFGSVSFTNAKDTHPKWDWNGSEDKPTLRPSILKSGGSKGCRYHGYLTDGVFTSC